MPYVTASPSKARTVPQAVRHESPSAPPSASSQQEQGQQQQLHLPEQSPPPTTTVFHSTLENAHLFNPGHQGQPLSLSFLHKKRHSDSETGSQSSLSSTATSPKLVRKKSGELVKSSLKLNSLAQGASKSMPTTPTYNKSVHFGVAVDVRYFDEKDKPTAVSADASPVLRALAKKKAKGHASFEMHGEQDGYDDEDGDEEEDTDVESLDEDDENVMIVWDMTPMNFGKIKYNEKFHEGSKLFLEKLILDEKEGCMSGSIAVKNLSFQKFIHVRYTFDSWRTVIEIEAQFTKEATRILKRADYDRFVFKIPLDRFALLGEDLTDIAFCIRYRLGTGTEEIWDNNHYKNYHVRLKRSKKLKTHGKMSAKMSLNDYFSNSAVPPPAPQVIDSYFNNYDLLRSPETPKVLKSNENLLDTPEFKDLSQYDEISDSVNKLSLYSDDSNVDLLKYKENHYTTASVPPHLMIPDTPAGQRGQNSNRPPPPPASTRSKPAINSKSYQELLDSYCFYKSGGPTTIASYFGESVNDSTKGSR